MPSEALWVARLTLASDQEYQVRILAEAPADLSARPSVRGERWKWRTRMGLDMYAYATNKVAKVNDVGSRPHVELAIWRKHYLVHAFAEDIYYANGGEETQGFNREECVRLDPEDVDRLERILLDANLPLGGALVEAGEYVTEGRFDDTFIERAREAFAKGQSVVYTSCW